jgi:hypothetical protein
MKAVSINSVPKKCGDAISVQVDGQWLVHSRSTNEPLALNETARTIFERCDGKSSVAQLSQQLAEEFECSFDVIVSDVRFALAQMEKFGLVSLSDGED